MDNNDYKSALEELLSQIREKSDRAELDIRRAIASGTIRITDKGGSKQSAVLPLTDKEAYLLAIRLVLCRVDPILMLDRVTHTLKMNDNETPEIRWEFDYVSDEPPTQELYEPVKVPILDDDTKYQLHHLSETVEIIRAELEKQGD